MRRSDLQDLKRFELLTGLDDTDREVLAQELTVRELEAGKRLFEQGDPADSLLLVIEGSVRIQKDNHGEFAEIGAGMSLGALALTGTTRREIGAQTGERTRVFELPRLGFERLVVAEPRTACRLLQAILGDQLGILYEAAQALEEKRQAPQRD